MDFRTKEEQVADFLREGIISGMFPRGSRLKQAEIAERLGQDGEQTVIVRRQQFFVDDEPMQLSDGYYPAHIAAGVMLW